MMFKPEDLKPGTHLKIAGFMCATHFGLLTFCDARYVPNDYIKICEYTIDFIIPAEFNSTMAAVESIDKQIDKLKDEHHGKMSVLQTKRDELLKLSYAGNDIMGAEAT